MSGAEEEFTQERSKKHEEEQHKSYKQSGSHVTRDAGGHRQTHLEEKGGETEIVSEL